MQQALALAADPSLYAIRVEAENDIVDVEIRSLDGKLVKGFQFKRRNQGNTWGQQELIDELARWSGLAADHPMATYEFVTDGRLGRTGLKVRDALEKASSGDLHDVRQLIAGKTGDIAVSDDSLTRASIRAEELAYADLISGAQIRARALLLNVTSEAEAEERGRWVVLELVNMITERSGLLDENARIITRDEVLQLLATPQDRIPTKQWDDALKRDFCASVLARTDAHSVQLACRPDVAIGTGSAATPQLLEHWAEPGAVRLLAGASGSGKSTVVLDMQRRAAEHGVVVITANAEDYIAGRLEALIAAGLNRHTYIGAHPAVGTAALADPEVAIAIDGVTEIPVETRETLEKELKQFLTATQRAELVLVGRGVTAMRAMLTRSVAATDLVVCPMSEDEQCQIVESFYQLETGLARWLVRQVGHAMQDVATNPLMLLLGAKAIALQSNLSSPATIFQTVISDLAEQCGYPDASVLVVGLGMAYAKLLDAQKRYCDTLDWVALLEEAAEQLSDAGHCVTVRRLREFGSETGLVRSAPFDTVRPFHDSFADFLAGVALSRSLADLPARFGEHDRARARFLAQLSGVSVRLAHLLTRDLPFTAVNVVPYERRSPEASWLDETKRHLDQLLPTAEARAAPADDDKVSCLPTVAYWEDADGRVLVTVGAGIEGWLGAAAPEKAVMESGWTFRLGEGQGPLTVAIRIWHRWLDQHLTPPALSGVAVPRTVEESCALLAAHSQALLHHRSELSALMELAGPDADALTEAATQRIQFAISQHHVDEERDRGVWFRERAELTTGEEVLVGELSDPAAWTGRGSVDSFVTTGAAQSASQDLRQIINAMVGRTWL
ncbi:AAA family ATPase [Mycobacterium heidelbergense]|uniref:AAA family ATPase n=1 Tax=Mycobacterium heidelbergense TaxID=53376 RepID=UPI003CEFC44E